MSISVYISKTKSRSAEHTWPTTTETAVRECHGNKEVRCSDSSKVN